MVELATVTEQIEMAFTQLSPQLKRAARYVLDAPDDVALNSMRTVAAHAAVHPSTMVRLAKRFDFPGYAEFREPFRERLRTHPAHYASRARSLQARRATADTEHPLYQEIVLAGSDNIERTFDDISPEALVAAVETLAAARRIYVVGMRKCYPVAFYFHYACRMFRDDVVLLNGWAATMGDELRGLEGGDALLAVSFDPYTRETVSAVCHAARVGAAIVAVTDSAVSPLARAARHTLLVANRSPSFFRSLVGAMALAEALVAFLVARGGEVAVRALADSEGQLRTLGAYWPDER
jgi:DNA-binding MurR/RpiR family transcriptional regulator